MATRLAQRLLTCLFSLLVLAGCAAEESPASAQKSAALTPAEVRTIKFELLADWHRFSGVGTLASSTNHSEGQKSLALSGMGYIAARNLTPLTKDDQQTPEVVGYDLWIPSQQPNPAWHGDTQLTIDAPSAGVYQQYLGNRSLQNLPKGQWVRVEFPVPNAVRQALNAANYTDLRFIIAVNVPSGAQPHYLDNFTLGPVQTSCTPVSDNNVCTSDTCNPATGQTIYTPVAPGTSCTDGNACNGAEACNATGVCQAGTPPVVDDGNVCTVDACDPSGGVTHTPVSAGTSCADEDACNGAEACNATGVCQAGTPPVVDDGNACTVDACDPSGGVTHTPVSAGTSCTDANACNGAEACDAAGVCQAGTAPAVDDGNPCTADACDPSGGVTHTPVSAGTSCSDANACNGAETCSGSGACVAGVPPVVDDGNACTVDACDPSGGVTHTPVSAGTSCADGDACNGSEACNGSGRCVAGTPPVVDDGNPCTADSCSASGGVTHAPVSAGTSCSDANACNGAEACNGSGTCVAGTPPVVDDGNVCTADSCNSSGGVTHTPVSAGTSCSDANACNGAETCDDAGTCVAGAPPVLDDGNPCTADSCSASGGVTHAPVSAGVSCSDANLCNGTEACDGAGSCAAGTPPVIDDGNVCTADACSPSGGVTHTPVSAGTSCADENACNGEETCSGAGTCVAGTPIEVDDGDPCTSDQCEPITGTIVHETAPAGTACLDGNVCNGAEVCDASGACVAGTPPLPPADDGDPCTVSVCDPALGYVTETCSAIDAGVTTTTFAATSWIFSGDHPLQVGVEEGTMDPTRTAWLRGQVTTRDGAPLPGVRVSVHEHDEYGFTLTQDNGWFDLVVNGGGPLVLDYAVDGYLPAQRRTNPAWNGSDVLPIVALVSFDSAETVVDLNAEVPQLIVGSTIEDEAGARQPVMLMPAGVGATLEMPDGSSHPVGELHLRITEYTVGPRGHLAMPAELPVTSAYTHAFEVSTEEALQAGAKSVTFSEPVVYYVDNYLEFPVGWRVPNGYYDYDRAMWVATETGVVLEVLETSSGVATLDVDGDGVADTGSKLDHFSITGTELEELAATYEPGAQLWRVRLPHLSTWDSNQGTAPPEGAGGPDGGPILAGGGTNNGGGCTGASYVDVANQVYQEAIPVAGTGRTLVYSSARAEGAVFRRQLRIPLTGDTPPAPLKAVEAELTIAGRQFGPYRFGPEPNQIWTFQWDGLDAYGRRLQGPQPYVVEVRFVYDAVYLPVDQLGSFPYKIPGLKSVPAQRELFFSQESRGLLAGWTAEGIGLGGWTLEGHDTRDLTSGVIERGDGTTTAANAGAIAERIDRPWPTGVTGMMYPVYGVGPDGSVYSGGQVGSNAVIVRTERSGVSQIVTGNGTTSTLTDGMLAVDARLSWPNNSDMAVAPDGTVYLERFEDFLYRIDQEGRLWKVAGGSTSGGSNLDGMAAVEADFKLDYFAVSPAGRVYVSTYSPSARIYEVDQNGILKAITGNACQDPALAPVDAINTCGRARFMAVGKDETIYVGNQSRVYKIDGSGTMTWIAGGGSLAPVDGVSAKDAALNFVLLAVTDEGEILLNHGDSLIAIGTNGLIRVIYDSGKKFVQAGVTTGIPVQNLDLRLTFEQGWNASHMLAAPGGIIVPTRPNNEVYLLKSAVPRFSLTETVVGSPDGSAYQVFDANGRLQQRNHRLLDTTLESYGYDAAGRLSYIEDPFGKRTRIERDGGGRPTAIVAPYGQRTELGVNADGLLASVTPPGSPPYEITYQAGGLLSTFQLPTGGTSVVQFDADGRLTLDQDSEGGFLSLTRTAGDDGSWSVELTKAEGSSFENEVLLSGAGPTSSDSVQSTYSDGLTSSGDSRRGEHTRVLPDGTEVTLRTKADPTFGTDSPLYKQNVQLPTSAMSRTIDATRSVVSASNGSVQTLTNSECVASAAGNLCETTVESAASQQRTRTSAAGRVTLELLDDLGRAIEVRTGGGPNLRTVYTDDQVTAIVIDPDTTPGNGNERTTTMGYDSAGRLVSVTDPLTHVTVFADFDAADRPETIVLPDSSEVQMTYDVMGNVASVTPPGQASHDMRYGLHGRIESYTPPVGNTVSYEYDLERHVDLIDFGLDGFGQPAQVDFSWDGPTGQLTSVDSPAGTIDVGYTLGKMTSVVAPSASGPITTNLVYDGTLPTSLGWSGPVIGQVNWTYNDRFLIQTETIGALASTAVTYGYDADGLVTQAGAMIITRDPTSGRVVSKTVGNLRESYQYSAYGELSRQTVQRMSGSTAVETLYDVIYDDGGTNGAGDALGRITKKTEWTVDGDTPTGGARPLVSREYDYGYNAEGRPWLESVAVDGNVVSSYSYDENGNRTATELAWSQLGYDAAFDASLDETETDYNEADQLLTYGSREYTWNAFGQLESLLDTATQDETFFTYDLYGNLLSVALPDGRTVEYDVDGAGRRVGRRVLDTQGVELEYRGWIYRDLLRPIAEVDAAGNVTARYVYLDGEGSKQNGMHQLATRLGANQDTSLPFAGSNVPEFIEMLDASGAVAQRLRLVVNQVGTVQAVVDVATGEVVQRLEHDEFGRVLFDSNPGLQPFGFAGGLVDGATGLVRFGARDYEPLVGRWTARDPVRQKGGLNTYAYASSDPIGWRDQSGFDLIDDLVDWFEDIFDIVSDLVDFADNVDCVQAQAELLDAKRACQQSQESCWGTSSTLETCAASCEGSGFNPTNPSDDWFNCYRRSEAWRKFGEKCVE